MNDRRGYTAIEMLISMGILSILSVFVFVALRATMSTMATGTALSYAQSNVRDVLLIMKGEIELAAREADASFNLDRLRVLSNGQPVDPDVIGDEVSFQIPLDLTGTLWSEPIRYQFVNEDLNDNSLLDGGEDLNDDGALTRRILRLQDLNSDGDTLDPGESRIVGGANDLSNVRFSVNANGDVLTVTLDAARPVANTRRNVGASLEARLVSSTLTSRVYLLN